MGEVHSVHCILPEEDPLSLFPGPVSGVAGAVKYKKNNPASTISRQSNG